MSWTPIVLARKDIRMLARTRALLLLLLIYPLAVAAIVGGVLLQSGPPRVAFVNEDKTGTVVNIGEKSFSIDDYVDKAEKSGVDVVRLNRKEAERAMDEGQVAGVLIVPQGTVARLETQLSGAKLEFLTGDNPLGSVVAQRMRGVIYNINLAISDALIQTNREYLDALVEGKDDVQVSGRSYDLYGLKPVAKDLKKARSEMEDLGADEDTLDDLDRAINFAKDASAAISLADNALEATAAPVRLRVERTKGKSPLLTAQAMGFALSVAIAFVCVVLIGASLASERDESVLSRLLRGLAHGWEIIVGKLLLGAALAIVFSTGLFVAFAILAPQAWTRLPLLLCAVIVASISCSAIGALIAVLVRDARTATLVGILLILPLAPIALMGIDGPGAWIENLLPVAPSRALFNAVLFDTNPWGTIAERSAQLLGVGLVTSLLATRLLRRLV